MDIPRIPEICKSGNIYLEKSLFNRISMPSCVGLNPSVRQVMRFLRIGPRCPPEASHGRQERFLIPEDPRNIAAENPPVIFRFGDAFSGKECPLRMPELYPSPDGSELCFCPTTGGLSDKNARSARRVRFSQVEPQIFYRMASQRKCNTQFQTPSYKYSFRLNEEQEIRFRQMLAAAGLERVCL